MCFLHLFEYCIVCISDSITIKYIEKHTMSNFYIANNILYSVLFSLFFFCIYVYIIYIGTLVECFSYHGTLQSKTKRFFRYHSLRLVVYTLVRDLSINTGKTYSYYYTYSCVFSFSNNK